MLAPAAADPRYGKRDRPIRTCLGGRPGFCIRIRQTWVTDVPACTLTLPGRGGGGAAAAASKSNMGDVRSGLYDGRLARKTRPPTAGSGGFCGGTCLNYGANSRPPTLDYEPPVAPGPAKFTSGLWEGRFCLGSGRFWIRGQETPLIPVNAIDRMSTNTHFMPKIRYLEPG